MPETDYYNVLGVSRDASDDDIKAAYRKLARELHPDVNKSADAVDRFQRVQDAYEVLSDRTKRGNYDRFGVADPSNFGGSSGAGGRQPVDFDDLGSMFDAFFGGQGPSGRSDPFRRPRQPKPEPPRDATHEIKVDFEKMARGGEHRLEVERGGERRSISVTIPVGVRDGTKLRVRGEGHPLPGRPGARSDLVLTVRVKPHPDLRRGDPARDERETDLFTETDIDIATATLGGSADVATINGTVELKIPEATASGSKLRLRAQGVGPSDNPAACGDLFAVIRIVPPAPGTLDRDQQAELRRIATSGASRPS